jgi:CHAD domain-containing protein
VSARLEKVAEKKPPEADHTGPAQVAGRALHLLREISQPARLSRSTLHPYRLKVKELRYTLKMAGRDKPADLMDRLGRCKDMIGEWHDWEELINVATQTLDHGRQCQLLARLRTTSENRYEQALSAAEKLRKTCADASNLSQRRRAGHGGPAQSTRKALSALAA